MTVSSDTPALMRTDTDSSALVAPAAATYVLAWMIGLGMGTGRVGPAMSDAEIQVHYTTNAMVVSVQATLVHLVAGGALILLAVGIAPLLASRRSRTAAMVLGLLAGVLSVAQAFVAYMTVAQAADQPGSWSRAMLDTIGTLDILKILLLAGFVTVVTTSWGTARHARAFRAFGIGTAVLLGLGAAALVFTEPLLGTALAASLVLLLAWVATTGVLVARARRT